MLELGSISYCNSLPVDYGLLCGAVEFNGRVRSTVPSALNRALESAELDVSPVSSISFARNSRDWILLPGFSISSESGVRSVLLFSKVPAEELSGRIVNMTSQGETTPALLKLLLSSRFNAEAHCRVGKNQQNFFQNKTDEAACLIIGDDALGAFREHKNYYVYDLAEEWSMWTSRPFVFAVWAVREAVWVSRRKECNCFIEALAASREWAYANQDRLLDEAVRRSGFQRKELEDYYRRLRYDLLPEAMSGMRDFFSRCIAIGILKEKPLLRVAEGVAAAKGVSPC